MSRSLWTLLLLVVAICLISAPCCAQEETDKTDKTSKARVAFVETVKGKEYVFIRLQPIQIKRIEAGRKKAWVPILLSPRQIAAVSKAVGRDNYRWSKIVIRVNPERIRKSKGASHHYTMREKAWFLKRGPKTQELETDEDVAASTEELDAALEDDFAAEEGEEAVEEEKGNGCGGCGCEGQ